MVQDPVKEGDANVSPTAVAVDEKAVVGKEEKAAIQGKTEIDHQP